MSLNAQIVIKPRAARGYAAAPVRTTADAADVDRAMKKLNGQLNTDGHFADIKRRREFRQKPVKIEWNKLRTKSAKQLYGKQLDEISKPRQRPS